MLRGEPLVWMERMLRDVQIEVVFFGQGIRSQNSENLMYITLQVYEWSV